MARPVLPGVRRTQLGRERIGAGGPARNGLSLKMQLATPVTGSSPSVWWRIRRRLSGIGATMFGAFFAITLMSVVAGIVAWTSFADIRARFGSVATESLPTMTEALTVAVEGSSLSAWLEELAAVRTEEDRAALAQKLSVSAVRFRWLLKNLNDRLTAAGKQAIPEELVADMHSNLNSVSERIKTMLLLRKQQKEMLVMITATHDGLVQILSHNAGKRFSEVLATTNALQYGVTPDSASQILSGVTETGALARSEADANRVLALLEAVSQTTDPEMLTSQEVEFSALAMSLERAISNQRDPAAKAETRKKFDELRMYGPGTAGLFEQKSRELSAAKDVAGALDRTRKLMESLSNEIRRVVALARGEVQADQRQVERSVEKGNKLIIAIILISLALSASIVWFYVLRRVARPLKQMAAAVGKLAGGDQTIVVPGENRPDEIGDLAKALKVIRSTGVRAARSQTALDNASSATLTTDLQGHVNYANQAARTYFQRYEGDMRSVAADFRADSLEGMNLALLLSGSQALQSHLTDAAGGRQEHVVIGRRHVNVILNPVIGAGGDRLGAVIEWMDVTDAMSEREAEQRFQADLAEFVEAAAGGDLSRRVSLAGRSGLMLKLGEGMNRWADAVGKALNEVVEMMSALAQGDLTKRIDGDYRGELRRLTEDSNATAEKLAAIVGRTVEGMTVIKDATTQLTAGSQDLSSRTEEQVSSLEEMAAAIRQMSATVRQNAENAQSANQLMVTARSAAESGGQVAQSAVEAVAMIQDSASRIADIVGLIEEIAFQTNLLALNAAVEAARAGDAGRGFAVVAQEVRALAGRAGQASKEIKGLIGASSAHVTRGVELVNKAGHSLSDIVSSVKRVAEIVSEIAAASREQSDGVQQVDASVTEMEAVTQKNAAMVEESNAALNAVDRQIEGLLEVVSIFDTGQDKKVRRSDARTRQQDLSERLSEAG
jgi:methyl-accepting chemotaxis protein